MEGNPVRCIWGFLNTVFTPRQNWFSDVEPSRPLEEGEGEGEVAGGGGEGEVKYLSQFSL
jgi:hypothetical protein